MYGKRASTYGMDYIKDFLEWESEDVAFIYCNYWIIGTETGRFSATKPAMQTIPSRETKDFRECFIARPNHKLVIVDWCQQEIGIQAFLAQDKKMMGIFNSGEDIYIRSAKEMLGKTIEKSDPLRSKMKAVVLGTDYDMTPHGLARKLDCSLDEAEELMNSFKKTFPQMFEYMDKQREKRKFVTTISGRKSWLNPYSDQCERNAINSPTQGTGADMLKKSIARMHKEWKFDHPFAIVEVTHDEIGLDVPEEIAQDVADFTEQIMVETANEMCEGMQFRVDKHICDNWSEAK
jgi:DNA polymerase-1